MRGGYLSIVASLNNGIFPKFFLFLYILMMDHFDWLIMKKKTRGVSHYGLAVYKKVSEGRRKIMETQRL